MAGRRCCILIELVVLTAYVEGISHNDKSTTMANEFLINKWRFWYKSLDVNQDGKVSMEDALESVNNFSEMEHLTTKKGEDIAKWWDECVIRERKEDIFEQEFVKVLNNDFNADKEEFKKEMNRCFGLIYSAADINDDNALSKEEYLIALAAYGHHHVAEDKDFFLAYNPTNGLAPLRVIVNAWVDFVTGTDESKGNIVNIWFQVDGFE